jgi:tetratricopeptide (TPR) repeat protein
MLLQRTLYTDWGKAYPKDTEIRDEAANIASWLGTLAMNQGKLEAAEAFFAEQVAVTGWLMTQEPKNAKWKEFRINALTLLSEVQLVRGRKNQAQESLNLALQFAQELNSQDQKNMVWQVSLGKCYLANALSLSSNADFHLKKAAAILNQAHRIDSKNEKTNRLVVITRLLQGQQALERNNSSQAIGFAKEAKAIVEPAWKVAPSELLRNSSAKILILEGEALLNEDRREEASKSFHQAMQLLSEHSSAELPFARLDDLVRVMHLLGQKEQAEKHLTRLMLAGFVPARPYP